MLRINQDTVGTIKKRCLPRTLLNRLKNKRERISSGDCIRQFNINIAGKERVA